jgi:crossover junction endodeoxyribonuclease RusA
VWAVLAIVFATVLSLIVGLAVNAVPKSWGWAHDWWPLVGISAGLVIAAVLVAVVQARSSPGGEERAVPVVRVGKSRRSPVAASNTGMMISAKKVIIRAARTADPDRSPPAPVVQRPSADYGERPGGILPPRNPVFIERDDRLAEAGMVALPWDFVVLGVPKSAQASWTSVQRWIEQVRVAAETAWPVGEAPLGQEVQIHITYYHDGAPLDVDNMLRPIQDALIGVVYQDDKQLTDTHGHLRDLNGRYQVRGMTPAQARGFTSGGPFVHVRVELPSPLGELP